MNRIEKRFADLAAKGEKAFIPFVAAGDPSLGYTSEIVLALEEAGSDVIELGVPFSDPIADGVVIQEAAQRALKNNVTLHNVVELVGHLRRNTEVPILLFTYFNPVLAYGYEAFAKDCAAAGVDGVLCVDLPPEESEDYKKHMDANGLATVYLLSPTSTEERIALVAENSTGFVYYVSRAGVTGVRSDVQTGVQEKVEQIKKATGKPVAVGFGVSKPEHAREIAAYADGVIVGSAIVRLIGELGPHPDMPDKVRDFAQALAQATKGQ